MSYSIEYDKGVQKELSRLPSKNIIQILSKIESLANDPYQSGIKKLKGYDFVYRARVGNYRILYEIDGGRLVIIVVAIGDRKDIYD